MEEIIIPKSDKKQEVKTLIPDKSNVTAAISLVKYLGMRNVKIVNAKKNPYENTANATYEQDSSIGLSSLGTPIYTDLTLLGVDYTDNLTGSKVTLPNDRFRSSSSQSTAGNDSGLGVAFYMNLETVIMVVEQPIRVIKTEIQGRNGTVKEYIGADDSKITINCIITGKNGVYPREEVNRLKRWLDAPVAKGVVAWWLDNLGISNVVVENYSIPQVQGGYSYQIVTIEAVSDAPVELKITQPIK